MSVRRRGRTGRSSCSTSGELRSRLSELGLALEVNREFGYAFTRQADDPSPRSRVILRTRTLSLAASALALYLYSQYVVSPDDPVVDTAT